MVDSNGKSLHLLCDVTVICISFSFDLLFGGLVREAFVGARCFCECREHVFRSLKSISGVTPY